MFRLGDHQSRVRLEIKAGEGRASTDDLDVSDPNRREPLTRWALPILSGRDGRHKRSAKRIASCQGKRSVSSGRHSSGAHVSAVPRSGRHPVPYRAVETYNRPSGTMITPSHSAARRNRFEQFAMIRERISIVDAVEGAW